ncbi:hypothetical protein [uncultured Meiothermus sp.]|jgi:hypothetical protein|uniref:hypothetical protein n=1 Tax=uncultured Meiothermus sp. TaxID=157471 RepID=UPI00260173E2|nr:hypothetical protein [uncultured Meiothermus sp.]
MKSLSLLYGKALLRNPWTSLPLLLLPLLALAFVGRGEAVAVVSLYSSLALLLPPLVLGLAVPLLSAREEWVFWAAMPRPASWLYLSGVVGIGLGLSLPVFGGVAFAGAVLGLSGSSLILVLAAGLGLLWLWVGLAGWVSAGLEASRALGLGLGLWGLLVLLYDPLVVALAVALREYPLEPLLLGALLLNPIELVRVAILEALEAPVLVGPAGFLLQDLLNQAGLALPAGASLMAILLALGGAAWRFGRRDR